MPVPSRILLLLGLGVALTQPKDSNTTEARAADAPPPAIPAADAAKKNPGKPTSEGLAEAKRLHGYHCAKYPGTEGDGKGDVAVQMKLHLKDWRNPDTLAKLGDGQLFPIITNGRRRSRL